MQMTNYNIDVSSFQLIIDISVWTYTFLARPKLNLNLDLILPFSIICRFENVELKLGVQINGYKSEVIAKHAKTTSVMAWNQEFCLNRKWFMTLICHWTRIWLVKVKKGQRVIRSHFWNPAIIAFTPLPTAATEIQLFMVVIFDQLSISGRVIYHNPGRVY